MEPPEDRAAHEQPKTTPPPAGPLPPEEPAKPTTPTTPAAPAASADEDDPAGEAGDGTVTAGSAPHTAGSGTVTAGSAAEDDGAGARSPLGQLSLAGRLVVALTVAAVSVGAVFHLGMVFLHVAPSNTLSTEHAQAVSDYIYPEFEQNWKLFAPDPVQLNTDVQARVAIAMPNGGTSTTGWIDLTAMNIAQIQHDLIPSHTVQNELRRAMDFYTSAHDAQDRPIGLRGNLSQQYMLRIVARKLGSHLNGGTVTRLQLRVRTTPIATPSWSAQKNATGATYRLLSWWDVTPEDFT